MISVSSTFIDKQEALASPRHSMNMAMYKQYPGKIIEYNSGYVRVEGNASNFFSTNDLVVLTTKDLTTEFTILSLTWSLANNYTTILFVDADDYSVVSVPGKDYVYLKMDVSDYIIEDNVGDIRKSYEDDTFGKLRPFQFNYSLIDDGGEYDLVGTKTSPQFLFSDSIITKVASVTLASGDTDIVLSVDLSGYDEDVLETYYVWFIDGGKRNNKIKIKSATIASDKITLHGDFTASIQAGDVLTILLQNKYYVKASVKIDGETSEPKVFFGVVYPDNITTANRRVDIISYSLLMDFNESFALRSSRIVTEPTDIPGIPGIEVYDYEEGDIIAPVEKVVKARLKFPSGNLQKIGGVAISSASVDVGSKIRILRYKYPNYFQFDGGTWTKKDTAATGQTLTAADGSTITADFRPSDYPKKQDAEEFLFFDPVSKTQINLSRRGPVGIQFDNGEEVQIYSKFFRIWVDDNYSAGTLTGLTDVSNDSPIAVVPSSTNDIAIYFTLPVKIGAIEFKGLRQLGNDLTSRMSWEYSIPYGVDPACFKSLTVSDGTSGLSQDGVVNLTIPEDFGALGKVGATTETSYFTVRLLIDAGTAYLKEFNSVSPYVVATGKDGDLFTVKADHFRLGKDEDTYEGNVIVRYDDDDGDTLKVAHWKQCVRVIDMLTEIVDKAGYGVNVVEPTYPGLLTRENPILNVWGKPYFSEERKPTAMAVPRPNDSQAGKIFVAMKNQIIMLESHTGNWSKIAEVDFNYTIRDISYFELSESSATRYFILAHGFKDVEPEDSIDYQDHFEQPGQVIVRVDDINTTPVARYTYEDNGGSIDVNPITASAGDGLIDNRFLYRSGAAANWATIPSHASAHIHVISGTISVTIAGAGTKYFNANSIAIPFPQLGLCLAGFIQPNILTTGDIATVGDAFVSGTGTATPDQFQPFTFLPGYYIYIAFNENVGIFPDVALKYTLGQRGGFTGVYFPDLATTQYGIYGQKYPASISTWNDNIRRYLYQTVPLSSLPLSDSGNDMGYGLWPQTSFAENASAETCAFFSREFLLDAKQMLPDDSTPYRDFVIQATLSDWYQMDTTSYKPNQARLEITTVRTGTDAAFIPSSMSMVHYDASAASYSVVNTNWGSSVQLDQNDILYFADTTRFARLYLQTSQSGTVSLEGYQWVMQTGATGSWQQVGLAKDQLSGGSGATNGLVDFPMQRHWHYIDSFTSGITGLGTGYQFGLKQTGTGSMTVSWGGMTRREIWDSDYEWNTNDKHYTPIEIEYNTYDKCVYGVMFDSENFEYSLFCLDDSDDWDSAGIANANTATTSKISFEQLTNPELCPTGFVHDSSDGWVYFVLADKKYQKTTAQLWRCKYDYSTTTWTTEKLSDIVPGEWDCPTRLVCSEGRIYGFTGPNRGLMWEWSDEVYLRLPIADFGNKKNLQVLTELSQILNYIVYTNEEAQTVIRNREIGTPSIDKTFGALHVANFEFSRRVDQAQGVTVSWEDQGSDVGSTEKIGITEDGNNIISISNSLIQFPSVAQVVGENVWNWYVWNKRGIEGTFIFLPQMQLFDQVNFDIADIKKFAGYKINNSDNWFIKSITQSFKRRNTRLVIVENKES